ncbi:MAG: transporter [Actinomycetales bacterium]|nr:MAG: transporter [Actinomycetales bacterium]
MNVVLWIATVLLSIAVLIGILRAVTATDGATRAVVGDLIFFSMLGILVLQGMLKPSAVVADATLIAAILGILATIALARILTRGRR